MTNDTEQYQRWIIEAAQRYGVPSDIALAMAREESNQEHYWRTGPNAGKVKVSAKGAVGIMQVMPSTAPGIDLNNPQINIEFGVRWLKKQFDRFGWWPIAVAAYDAGEDRVSQWLKGLKSLPQETLQYVHAVTGRDVGAWRQQPSDAGAMASNQRPSAMREAPPPASAHLSQRQILGIGLLAAAIFALWTR